MKENMKHRMNESELPKQRAGYTVPEGYFDSFADRLEIRINKETATPAPVAANKGWLIYLKPALSVAAGLALLLTLSLFFMENQTQTLYAGQEPVVITPNGDSDDLLPLPNVFAYLVTDGQFFSALTDMEEYDESKLSKDVLADYLASNCSDFEILNANK